MDPDRFFQFPTPGAQEWWYFDAISDDGRDALVLVWYAGLPFDPDYGVAAIKHVRQPDRFPMPHALDHSAIGVSWYRDGKPMAYALNGFRRGDFHHTDEPFGVTIAENHLSRDPGGYDLRVETPDVKGQNTIRSTLRFTPASGTIPLERELGSPESPHVWILAAADCRVEGRIDFGSQGLTFRGRGYHDHNAGSEEISLAMKRWVWGRVHHGAYTEVYYGAEPHAGKASHVWITCREGRPESIREVPPFEESADLRRNVFGIRHGRSVKVSDGQHALLDGRTQCVDDGPFYRRWHTQMDGGEDAPYTAAGISELLETRNLNRPLFNWMIPYRLKRPEKK